ncbi:hypothetical protein SO802_004637 [Lithocarpus litseifolius]|uniref:Uncharacterized protein n=1 Tax=Lithocarpus litseifolius TaxID=425828 RepID=A0AAW2E3L7_9ROSI
MLGASQTDPGEEEEENPVLLAATITTLQKSSKFKNLFDQLGLTAKERKIATEALESIASRAGVECFSAEVADDKALLQESSKIAFSNEDMEMIRIAANPSPFEQAEAHLVETMFYDQWAPSEESSVSKPRGTFVPKWEDIWGDPEFDLRELLSQKKKRKEAPAVEPDDASHCVRI